MNRTKQITIAFLAAIALLVSLKLIGNRFTHPPEGLSQLIEIRQAPEAERRATAIRQQRALQPGSIPVDETKLYTDLQTNKDGAVHGRLIQTVRMDLQTENYKAMKQAMTETLQSLGIEPEERIVQQLVGARIKADWSEVPEHFKDAPDWAALESFKLKRAIAHTLKTEDPITLQRVLETKGPALPPMADYKLRTGPNAVYDEAKAIEAMK